jgi:spore coat polysaccharide biosynthesis protein SpsF (cytidylyltransferase family)
MSVGAIIVCRLDSRRLPGKVLKEIQKKPLLWYVFSKCRQIREVKGNTIIATTSRKVDDPIEHYCREKNIRVFRGATKDVAARVLNCALANRWEYFIRVNADSPFLEPSLVSRALYIAKSLNYEIVTNLYPRSFPYGVSIELFRTDVFQSGYKLMNAPDHFEHVTRFFYQNIHRFHYYNITREGNNLSGIHMTIDNVKDFCTFKVIIDKISKPWESLSYLDVLDFYTREDTLI